MATVDDGGEAFIVQLQIAREELRVKAAGEERREHGRRRRKKKPTFFLFPAHCGGDAFVTLLHQKIVGTVQVLALPFHH